MLERAADEGIRPSAGPRVGRRWPLIFVACAGLMGAAGVGIGAAAAHISGGDLARTASEFLLLHAAVVVGASALAASLHRTSVGLVAALTLFVVGSILFSGELTFAALWTWRPLPLAAPTGGLCLIAGWLTLTITTIALAAMRA